MNAYTIDADNNIKVQASRKEARETGAGVFDTAENLAELIVRAEWSLESAGSVKQTCFPLTT